MTLNRASVFGGAATDDEVAHPALSILAPPAPAAAPPARERRPRVERVERPAAERPERVDRPARPARKAAPAGDAKVKQGAHLPVAMLGAVKAWCDRESVSYGALAVAAAQAQHAAVLERARSSRPVVADGWEAETSSTRRTGPREQGPATQQVHLVVKAANRDRLVACAAECGWSLSRYVSEVIGRHIGWQSPA